MRGGSALTPHAGRVSSEKPSSRIMSRLIRAVLVAAAVLPIAAHAQVQRVIVRGRVTTDSGRVVPGASVVVTRRADTTSRRTQTDARGEYAVDWPGADAQYTLVVSAPSFQQYTADVARPANDSVIV